MSMRSSTVLITVRLGILAMIVAAGLTTAQRTSANQQGPGVESVATMQIMLCRNFGGHEEVEVTRTGSGFVAVWVVCRGGLLDGMDCANGPGPDGNISDCRWPGKDAGAGRESGTDLVPPSLPPLTESPPVVVDEAPPVAEPTATQAPEPTVEIVTEDPVVDGGEVVSEDGTVDEGEVIVEPPVVDNGAVVEDPIVNDGSLDEGGKNPGPTKGDPVDVKPKVDGDDILPIEDIQLT